MNRQQRIWQNKVNHHFNLTDTSIDFKLLQGEVEELREALGDIQNKEHISEELSDVVIFCYGLAEMCHIDLDTAIENKMLINESREYIIDKDGTAHKIV